VKAMREEEQFWRSIEKEIVRQKDRNEQEGKGDRQETLKRSPREEMTERDAL